MTDWRFKGGVLTIRNHVDGRFHTTKENIYQFNLSIFLPKNSYLTETINNFVSQCLAGGFLEQWAKLSNPKQKDIPDVHLERLNVEHFSGCFYLCAGGYFVAVLVFVAEIVYTKFRQINYVQNAPLQNALPTKMKNLGTNGLTFEVEDVGGEIPSAMNCN